MITGTDFSRQGKGNVTTYWLIGAEQTLVHRRLAAVRLSSGPSDSPLLSLPLFSRTGLGSTSSLALKRASSLRRSLRVQNSSPILKRWTRLEDELGNSKSEPQAFVWASMRDKIAWERSENGPVPNKESRRIKAGLHVRRKHEHNHKHKHKPRVNQDDASTSARKRNARLCLCLCRTCKPAVLGKGGEMVMKAAELPIRPESPPVPPPPATVMLFVLWYRGVFFTDLTFIVWKKGDFWIAFF